MLDYYIKTRPGQDFMGSSFISLPVPTMRKTAVYETRTHGGVRGAAYLGNSVRKFTRLCAVVLGHPACKPLLLLSCHVIECRLCVAYFFKALDFF